MFFEAVEKKLEVTVCDQNLHDLDERFWLELVKEAKASVLSSFSNTDCKAYLLSESTLLVWPHRMTLITCGQTSLVSAVLFFLKNFPSSQIKSLIFERKNEKNPDLQESSFFEDIEQINHFLQGKAYCFQSQKGPKLYLYETQKEVNVCNTDVTLEVLCHNLKKPVRDFLRKAQSKEEIRQFLKLDEFFGDFQKDDHLFSPFGYSLNALCKSSYYMIHMSPEKESSYVSFETNVFKPELISKIVQTLCPEVCEVILFSDDLRLYVEPIESYFQSNLIETYLKSNYKFDYLQLSQSQPKEVFKQKLSFKSNPLKEVTL